MASNALVRRPTGHLANPVSTNMTMILVLVAIAALVWFAMKRQPTNTTLMTNGETWKWTDWRDRPREITVARHIEVQ